MNLTNTPEEQQKLLSAASFNYQSLLQETHNEALLQNEIQTKQWQDYRTEHRELSTRLLSLRDNLSHTVMVPLGKKALMRGNLVHTNEILVCLGDGWFAKLSAKQASDVCQRRMENCDEMLQKLQKESDLLTSRKFFTHDSELFTPDQTQEIIEPYDEGSEMKWRESHRQKQKEYHQKLAELRKNQKSKKIETEEDLWSRLDALDLQEELEDELNRLDEGEEAETEGSDSDSSKSDSEKESNAEHDDKSRPSAGLKRRVSFKEDRDNNHSEEDCGTGFIHITFKHGEAPSHSLTDTSAEINSPADIYAYFLKQRTPKSILKVSPHVKILNSLDTAENQIAHSKHAEEEKLQPTEPVIEIVGEVVEHLPATSSAQSSQRPISRFKASRLTNKR